jgi:hypothetical protein
MTPSAPPHAPPNLSDCERQLFALTAILKQTMTKLAQCRPEAKDSLQDPLESLAGEINKMKTLCFECEKLLSENARRSAFLLSRKHGRGRGTIGVKSPRPRFWGQAARARGENN